MLRAMDAPDVAELSAAIDLAAQDVEPRGFHVGKLALGIERRLAERPRARYIAVTATTPTPLGEGKTVTTIGLAMALVRLGRRAIPTLREPSRAPVFGIKGGGAGGGRAALVPSDTINLHLTGDLDAVAAANNLLAAMIDNHVRRARAPAIDPGTISWKRVCDVSDRALTHVMTGLGGARFEPMRETGFELTAASEVMAILALAQSLEDLRRRLGNIVVASTPGGDPVRAEDVGCAGAMAALLRDALRPNLVSTSERGPALVHAGPFANIAHGNCSVLADLAAVRLADYVVTEAGFASEAGAEKLLHIKCRASGLVPDAVVLVTTVRATKVHSGRFDVRPGRKLPEALSTEDLEALRAGADNLQAHLDNLAKFGLPVVVAINRFPTDAERELAELARLAKDFGARDAVVSDAFSRGSEGALDLARAVQSAAAEPSRYRALYELEAPLADKLRTLATELYGAADLDLEPLAAEKLKRFEALGFGRLPVCVAKTQYSLSHDAKLRGRPRDYRFPIRDVRLAAGAGYVYALAGDISTMPGLPKEPAALAIDVTPDGRVVGLR
jgi:formate--tetrahydrofolate ligase